MAIDIIINHFKQITVTNIVSKNYNEIKIFTKNFISEKL